MTTVTDEILGKLARQQHDLFRRVRDGKLDPTATSVQLQRIIEGKAPGLMRPSWYRSPDQQLMTVMNLYQEHGWPFRPRDFLDIPAHRVPPTPDAVLMAGFGFMPDMPHVTGLQDSFDRLSDQLETPGFARWRWPGLKSDPSQLSLRDGYEWRSGVRWLWFDPNSYLGMSPKVAYERSKIDDVRLAGVEVMMAAILFPGWVTSWGGPNTPRPNMSGLHYRNYDDSDNVPYLYERRDDRELRLDVTLESLGLSDYANPTVWKC